jgi:hypothetical protein
MEDPVDPGQEIDFWVLRSIFWNRVTGVGPFLQSISSPDYDFVFKYRNERDTAFVISNVISTCSFIAVTFSSEPLQPDDSTSFVARYHARHVGSFRQMLPSRTTALDLWCVFGSWTESLSLFLLRIMKSNYLISFSLWNDSFLSFF